MTHTTGKWVTVDRTFGPGPAEIIRGFLEACGIEARISLEGAWEAIPLTVGSLGEAEVLVREEDEERALEFIQAYYDGEVTPGEDQTEDELENGDVI